MAAMARHRVVVFGPALDALSGVSTHVRVLLASDLPRDYELLHFQVGSEGRRENAAQKLLRFIVRSFSSRVLPPAHPGGGRSSQCFPQPQRLLA